VLQRAYRRSLCDLAALRFYPDIAQDGESLPAAGLPWFMTLFGRDSLITSFQALPYRPNFARTTLTTLAALQGTRRDDRRDEDPGKILHELRFGELTETGERPHSPYYGAADSTPLFLVLLDEHERWTGDAGLARQLEGNARAALEWIDRHGDLDGDGYVEYATRNPAQGLVNQCWKDSWNSILFADGTLARGPIATCEIQGYVFDAKRRTARLAREVWDDPVLADRLDAEAVELRRRFLEDFWIPERSCFALALDGDKRRVDSLCSNMGHLLWSGILDEARAEATARHLMGPALYSGWGVRTMAATERGYNPVEYHNGTVWPHDGSLIATGLARYGHRDAAAQIAADTVRAASFFGHRLPEVFAGNDERLTHTPVEFPTASSPQAWA
jgi:glycogen debranching enzyme